MSNNIEGIIHFVIFYKLIIKRFLKYFSQKYLKINQFRENFIVERNFNIFIKEGHGLELSCNKLNINFKPYAPQLYSNAIQRKLQSRR